MDKIINLADRGITIIKHKQKQSKADIELIEAFTKIKELAKVAKTEKQRAGIFNALKRILQKFFLDGDDKNG